ncbi:NosD domain-containing protein, partial [Candidatus Solirubrobacter pratensis]|uniref:NosD domain-containing protein n=1 Tax=Candidatus Solirubrobacter pratensis TaxID=1298857 RepID=UPI0018C9DF2F
MLSFATRARRWSSGALVGLVVAVGATASARAADLHATPSSFASVFGSASTGDRVLLAAGSYGTFRGALKSGNVTVMPEPGAVASMALSFNPASNITIDGLKITGSEMSDARTKNITVRNSSFDNAQAVFRTGYLQNANIVFDHNTHIGWNACSSCGEGRVWFPERTAQPAGITIQNSLFSGGNSDGIQNGGNGVQILNNTFMDMHQTDGASGGHVDGIQLYGSKNTVIRGNFFYNVPDSVAAWDGSDHEMIEDNVVVT